MTSQPTPPSDSPTPAPAPFQHRGWPLMLTFCMILSIGCLAAALWIWYGTQLRISALRIEIAGQVLNNTKQNDSQGVQIDVLQNQIASFNRVVGRLESQHSDIHAQQIALADLYKDVTQNKDRRLIGDVEHLMMAANQALQLSNNVRSAIRALETADSMLAKAENPPRYIALRRALAADLERLRSVPEIDVVGTALKIDALTQTVDNLPLLASSPNDAVTGGKTPSSEKSAGAPFWRDVVDNVWQEIKSLIAVRYLDSPDRVLLSPEQAFFVRENVKLQLLAARLSLLSREDVVYHQNLEAAQMTVRRYFDLKNPRARSVIQTLSQLDKRHPAISVLTLDQSYAAFRDLSNQPVPQPTSLPAPGPKKLTLSEPVGKGQP